MPEFIIDTASRKVPPHPDAVRVDKIEKTLLPTRKDRTYRSSSWPHLKNVRQEDDGNWYYDNEIVEYHIELTWEKVLDLGKVILLTIYDGYVE